ncbi:MAG: response regulator [Desulfobulbaceae bacterium]|nr:response regulator [Desulfobulbaceae bacterium]
MWKGKSSIKTKFLNRMILIVFVSIGLWCLIWVDYEYSEFETESKSLRSEHFHSQKLILKKEVSGVVTYINNMRQRSEEKLKAALKERVYEAHQIAMNIYIQNVDSKDLSEIKKMIKDALRTIRFNDGRGYYFAASMDGVEQLYPINPEFEGKDLLGLQDAKGNFVIQDEIDIIKANNEGFVKDFWAKPGVESSVPFPKISFIKYFKPLNWYFGTGEYLDEVKKQFQEEILERIVSLRFGTEGYFFGSTYRGDSLFSNGEISEKTVSLWDLTDPNGVKIIQEQRKAVENPSGGFVKYSWNKLNTSVPSPKISFVQGISEWGWTIGAGVYVDTIEETIASNKLKLFNGLKKRITRSLLTMLVLFGLIYFWSRRISSQIQKSVDTFLSFLSKSSSESTTINPNDIQFQEFKDIAIATNEMLEGKKQAQKDLRKSEELLRSTQELAKIGGWEWDVKNQTMFWTEEVYRIHGLQADEFEPGSSEHIKKSLECYNPADLAFIQDAFQKCCKEGVGYDYEFPFTTADGRRVWIRTVAKPILNNGKIVKVLGNIIDITEQKQGEKEKKYLESRLHQSQKMEAIGTLAGGIAHDFNNILSAILGYAEMAKDECQPGSTISNDLAEVLEAGNRAKKLVSQILEFSRQDDTERMPLEPANIVNKTIKLLRPSLPATIEINQNITPKTGLIFANPTQVHQILMNLCTNAFHAMEMTGGTLDISLKEMTLSREDLVHEPDVVEGTFIQISIGDSGQGVSPMVKDKIFNPFFTTKEVGKGTGMGLSIAHGIVKSYGGFISLYSELGEGAVFHVFLPVIETEVLPANEISDQIPTGKERILFVDDEEILAKMGKTMLERLGYHVTVRQNSLEALKTFQDQLDQVDLVITDQTMPGMTGSDLSRRMLQIRPDIPIILCTGYSTIISEEKAKSMGIKAFALKPLAKKDIAKLIRKVLDA